MSDSLHNAYFDSLTFGVDTTIGYFDLSDEATAQQALEDEAGNETHTGGKWIKGHELKGKLERLSSFSGEDIPEYDEAHPGNEEDIDRPQIVFLAAYGLPRNRDLAIRKDHFVSILDSCRFPKAFLQSMCEKTGHFAYFTSYNDEESPSWISVVVKTPHSPANFSLVLRTRISDRSTICFLIIQDDEMLMRVVDRLYARKDMLQEAPLQILNILCEEYGHRNELWREALDRSIVGLEQRIVKTYMDIEGFDEGINNDEPLIRNLHKTKYKFDVA